MTRGGAPHTGSIPGDAEQLAGALAELGCKELRLGNHTLSARHADLPGQLRSVSDSTRLVSEDPPVTILLGLDEWTFETSDQTVADRLNSI